MKKVVLVAFLGLACATPALSADLPERPYSVPASYEQFGYDWTGFYIGLNGGYGMTSDCLRISGPLGVLSDDDCRNASGGVVGGQLGYRWQFGGGPIVWGLEAQGDWASLRGSHVSFIDPTITNQTELKGFGLFTGQLGVAINNILFYVKAGAAVTADRYAATATAGGALLGSVGQARWGGTAGVGLEYGFTPNWTAAFEYDRLFMGGKNFTLLGPAGIFFTNEQITRDVDVFTVRVNYKFGGPTIARF